MKKHSIITGSVTYAMRSKDVLKNKGYKNVIVQRMKNSDSYGCGYAVTLITDDISKAVGILEKNGIKYIKIV